MTLGPPRLPVVGSFPFFYKRQSLNYSLRRLVQEYGPVTGFYIGNQKAVVITDFDILKGKTLT